MRSCLILAGGKSSRFPVDKTSLELGGQSIIQKQLDLLRDIFPLIIIVANRERRRMLSRYRAEGVEIVEETVRGAGPLGGIYSGILASGAEVNLVVGCDMPFLNGRVIEYLLGRIEDAEAVIPRSQSGIEPLHGVYREACRDIMRSHIEEGRFKISDFLEEIEVDYVPIDELLRIDPTGGFLFNVNTPEDYIHAQEVYVEYRHG